MRFGLTSVGMRLNNSVLLIFMAHTLLSRSLSVREDELWPTC